MSTTDWRAHTERIALLLEHPDVAAEFNRWLGGLLLHLESPPSPEETTSALLQLQLLANAEPRLLQNGFPSCLRYASPLALDPRVIADAERRAAGAASQFYLPELVLAQRDATARRMLGSYYTPGPLVDFLLRRVAEDRHAQEGPAVLVDPSCGGGAFLNAARRLAPEARLVGLELQFATALTAVCLLDGAAEIHCGNALNRRQPLAAPDEYLAIVGNPPWSNFGTQNRTAWVDELLSTYKDGLRERKHNLHDDYIRFVRWSQYQLSQVKRGAIALVLNNSFLDGLTHRRMRESLLGSFWSVDICNLHGHLGRRETEVDENVFEVQQGVTLLILRKDASAADRRVRYAELRGTREDKLRRLSEDDVGFAEFSPVGPDYRLCGVSTESSSPAIYPTLDAVVKRFASGVQSKRDSLFVDIDADRLAERMEAWLGAQPDVETPEWLESRRRKCEFDRARIRPYMTAPLDTRYLYYDPALIGRARLSVMQHMLGESASDTHERLGLVFMRQSKNAGAYDHFLAVSTLVSDRVFYSIHGAPYLAPWQLRGERDGNLHAEFIGGGDEALSEQEARRWWSYYYAVFHSSDYRTRYASQLRINFPALPPPKDSERVADFVEIGKQLIDTHVAGARQSRAATTRVNGFVQRPVYDRKEGRLVVNDHLAVAVPENVLQWRIGGYRVIQRWLTQRVGAPCDERIREELEARIEAFLSHSRLVAQLDALAPNWR